MSKVTYQSSSPYGATKQSSWHIDRYVHRTISSNDEDREFVLDKKYEHRPDLLSNDLYGTPAYWWVFYVRNVNVIRDPIWDFVEGVEFIVPSSAHIKRTFGG